MRKKGKKPRFTCIVFDSYNTDVRQDGKCGKKKNSIFSNRCIGLLDVELNTLDDVDDRAPMFGA